MTTIIGIPGSLRSASYNRRLLHAAAELAPEGVEIRVDSIDGIPLYDADVEEFQGQPDASEALKERIAEADGLLIATPEYDAGIPGVAKNAFDWLSRPPSDRGRVFKDLPVGLIGATPGQGGTRFAQAAWLPTLRWFGMRLWPGDPYYMAGARDKFDEDGRLTDETSRELLARYVEGFAEFCRETSRRAATA